MAEGVGDDVLLRFVGIYKEKGKRARKRGDVH